MEVALENGTSKSVPLLGETKAQTIEFAKAALNKMRNINLEN
jgi:hypothetical protein